MRHQTVRHLRRAPDAATGGTAADIEVEQHPLDSYDRPFTVIDGGTIDKEAR
ncbi:hypothetical protein AB0O91_30160 [Kitasatospora sp. NPDC089797]|uniref:hypothetical protein n=1 Tax=Kitasatospora sp. NPDC089797 TaxID=3155298 RepID=UPI00341B726B